MPFLKTTDVAQYGRGDWSQLVKVASDTTPEAARRMAVADPAITFFFYCRERVVLTDPDGGGSRTFEAGDAAFFGGEPHWGSAPQCDGYVKDGLVTVYEGHLSTFDPTIVTQYTTAQGLNAVDVVCLFAANIANVQGDKQMRLAPHVDVPAGGTLAVASSYYGTHIAGWVKGLHAAGIAVVMTFLGNRDPAGWSCFDPYTDKGQTDAQNFALQLQYVVQHYGLDGIDIDDELSTGTTYPASLAMVTSKIRALLPDAIISKALWSDLRYFGQSYDGTTLEQMLTCGWEMTYDTSAKQMLPPYVEKGMAKAALSKGYWANNGGYQSGDVGWLKANGYGGVMAFEFDQTPNQTMTGVMVDDWMGAGNWNPASPT